MSTTTPPETSGSVSSLLSGLEPKINHFLLGCHNYSLPAHPRQHIDLIGPTVHLNYHPSPLPINRCAGGLGVQWTRTIKQLEGCYPSTLATCDKMIILDCLRALYSINYSPVATNLWDWYVQHYPSLFTIVNSSQSNLLPKHFWVKISKPGLCPSKYRPSTVLIDGGDCLRQYLPLLTTL